MLPKKHALLGIIFSILIYFIFKITYFEAFLIFFASVFIDFDHYIWYIIKKKDFSLKKNYNLLKFLEKPPRPIMVVFHTIEFILLVFVLSFFFNFLFFILIGMIFHSILDVIDMQYKGILNLREFSLIRYLVRDKKKYF